MDTSPVKIKAPGRKGRDARTGCQGGALGRIPNSHSTCKVFEAFVSSIGTSANKYAWNNGLFGRDRNPGMRVFQREDCCACNATARCPMTAIAFCGF